MSVIKLFSDSDNIYITYDSRAFFRCSNRIRYSIFEVSDGFLYVASVSDYRIYNNRTTSIFPYSAFFNNLFVSDVSKDAFLVCLRSVFYNYFGDSVSISDDGNFYFTLDILKDIIYNVPDDSLTPHILLPSFGTYINYNLGINLPLIDALYQELLDNSETASNLNLYINGGDTSAITDKDLAFQKNIELYNANVLALRATKNINLKNESIDVNQTSEQNIDLSATNAQIKRIADNLQYTNTDDLTKSLTQIVEEKDNSVLVENNMVSSAPFNPHISRNTLFEG